MDIQFLSSQSSWDVFHLAYMMYVPGLQLLREERDSSIVRMIAEKGVAVGTSSYIVSKTGHAYTHTYICAYIHIYKSIFLYSSIHAHWS